MTKELDPVVDKSLEETIHKEAYRLFYFTNAGSSLPISEARKSMQLVAKESKSTATEDAVQVVNKMMYDSRLSKQEIRILLKAKGKLEELKLKIDKGE